MKSIVIAFSLKNQDFNAISEKVKEIAEKVGRKNVILIHGFMPSEVVKEKGLDVDVSALFKKYFPVQLNMYDGGTLRDRMATAARLLKATVYVIGEVKGGVHEEVRLYLEYGLKVNLIKL